MILSFALQDEFIDVYKDRPVAWGFPSAAGLTVGELTFLRTYSRKKEDETKERWHETVRRVVEGSYSIQKDYIQNVTHTTWDDEKAQRSAQEMYERMFGFKFWAPGRGLENMGTEGVNGWGYSDRLYNCAFESTRDGGSAPFARLFTKSMRGVGVGYDVRGAGKNTIHEPKGHYPYTVSDSTEGWVQSTTALLDAFFTGGPIPKFNYDRIRPKGSPIRSGGRAPGAEPLRSLHRRLERYYRARSGEQTTSRTIVDTANMIGKAVVSGGKRRTALLVLGSKYDADFMRLKDPTNPANAERLGKDGWGWAANHSIDVFSTDNIDWDEYAASQIYGEPGIFVRDLVQTRGRMIDPSYVYHDPFAIGTNPCGEISLENHETCNVVSVNMATHSTKADFLRTLKFAFLYAKSVTLMPTSWSDTNVVQMRNRRIGVSLTGVIQFLANHSKQELVQWMHDGYQTLREWDEIYSRWFGVRESIKVTTIKPEGTASLLAGATPGVHYPVESTYIRRMQFDNGDPLIEVLADAGYYVEPYNGNPDSTSVVELPTKGPQVSTEKEVSIGDKLDIALIAQRYWADNSVSFTLTFDPKTEQERLGNLLRETWGQYKSITCMPMFEADSESGRELQLPYEGISDAKYDKLTHNIRPVDIERVYQEEGVEQVGDKFCETDHCEI